MTQTSPVTPSGRHDNFIRTQAQPWMKALSPSQFDLAKAALLAEQFTADGDAPWFTAATPTRRDELVQAQLRRTLCRRSLSKALSGYQGLLAFAEPVLTEAIRMRYGLALDVQRTDLIRVRTETPLGGLLEHHRPYSQTVLMAAMGNFAEQEVFHAFSALAPTGSLKSSDPFTVDPWITAVGHSITKKLAITPAQFALFARELDLGRLYQEHLADVFESPSRGDAVAAAMILARRAELDVLSHVARLKGDIDDSGFAVIQALLNTGDALWAGRAVKATRLNLLGDPLHDIVLLGPERRAQFGGGAMPCLVWIPGDPRAPLKQYTSSAAFSTDLAGRLTKPDYLTFFLSFVAQQNRAEFKRRLHDRLWRSEEGDGGKKIVVINTRPQLDISEAIVAGELFAHLHNRHVAWLKAEARWVAVPTEVLDSAQRLERWEGWLQNGVSLLNLAALFIPALGVVMLPVMAQQMLSEVYHGVEAWEDGRTEEALEHLKGILTNVALVVVTHAIAEDLGSTYEAPLDTLEPVTLANGQRRLLHPDLAGYASDTVLPADVPADSEGLYNQGGRQFVKLDDTVYEARRDTPADNPRIVHPTDTQAYRPALRSNGAGAWQHEFEQPLQWQGATLVRRFGAMSEGLSDAEIETVRKACDISEAHLRERHVNGRKMPASLHESLLAWRNERDVDFKAPPAPLDADAQLLHRDFPKLPVRMANELVAAASDAELTQLQVNNKVPVRLAEAARAASATHRLNQAQVCLARLAMASDDGRKLALGLLEHLPGWTGKARIELRQEGFAGELLAAIGPADGELKYVIARDGRYRAYDARELELSPDLDLFTALCRALPDSERDAVGLSPHSGETLRRRLFDLAVADRDRAALLLKQRRVQPWFKSPQRYGEHIGYELSGRGYSWWNHRSRLRKLYPRATQTEFELFKSRLAAEGDFELALQRREQEYKALKGALAQWRNQGPHFNQRLVAGEQLISAWREEISTLDFSGSTLGELPVLTAEFPYVKHLRMNAMRITADPSAFLSRFPDLITLNLDNNRLPRLPAQIRSMGRLVRLEASNNQLVIEDDMFDVLLRAPDSVGITDLTLRKALKVVEVAGEPAPNPFSAAALRTLKSLPRLRWVDLSGNALTFDDSCFTALGEWQQLQHLHTLGLHENFIQLTPLGRTALAGLKRLVSLNLGFNDLGLAPDVSQMTSLQYLRLYSAGISRWPAGLTDLLSLEPMVLREADLADNLIQDVPGLTGTTLGRLNQSFLVRDREVLRLDLNPLSGNSRRNLRDLGIFPRRRMGEAARTSPLLNRSWLEGCPPDLRAAVDADRGSEGAEPFYRVMDQVARTAAYRSQPVATRKRMWRIMRAVLGDTEAGTSDGLGIADLREELFAEAAAVEQTCGDGISLTLERFETDISAWKAASQAMSGGSGMLKPLLSLSRQLFKQALVDEQAAKLAAARLTRWEALDSAATALPELSPLDDISDNDLQGSAPDPVEIRLLMRTRLHQRLSLPAPPEMLYTENLSAATVKKVGDLVVASATDGNLKGWIVDQPHWLRYVKKVHAERFQFITDDWADVSTHFEEVIDADDAFSLSGVRLGAAQARLQQLDPTRNWTGAPVHLDVTDPSDDIPGDRSIIRAEIGNGLRIAQERLMAELTAQALAQNPA